MRRTVWLAAVMSLMLVESSFASERPVTWIGDPIPVSLDGKPPVSGIAANVLNLAVGGGLRIGATAEGELVLQLKPLHPFSMPIPQESIDRFKAALEKGSAWCTTVSQRHVAGAKLIDEWSWQGVPVFMPTQKPGKQSLSIWMSSVDEGRFCSVGIKATAGIAQKLRAFIPHENIAVVVDRLRQIDVTANETQRLQSHSADVLDSLR